MALICCRCECRCEWVCWCGCGIRDDTVGVWRVWCGCVGCGVCVCVCEGEEGRTLGGGFCGTPVDKATRVACASISAGDVERTRARLTRLGSVPGVPSGLLWPLLPGVPSGMLGPLLPCVCVVVHIGVRLEGLACLLFSLAAVFPAALATFRVVRIAGGNGTAALLTVAAEIGSRAKRQGSIEECEEPAGQIGDNKVCAPKWVYGRCPYSFTVANADCGTGTQMCSGIHSMAGHYGWWVCASRMSVIITLCTASVRGWQSVLTHPRCVIMGV